MCIRDSCGRGQNRNLQRRQTADEGKRPIGCDGGMYAENRRGGGAVSYTHLDVYKRQDKYKFLVRAKSRAYFLIGADNEDIIQEGMIGLYKACLLYTSRCV